MKHIITGLGLTLLISLNSSAQNFKLLEEQFEKSYAYENEGDYTKARDALKKVYKAEEDNYVINLRLDG